MSAAVTIAPDLDRRVSVLFVDPAGIYPDLVADTWDAARDARLYDGPFRQMQNDGTTYGYYPGGDPRDFSPDGECCTEAELAAHKEACAAWDRGERPKHEAHRRRALDAERGALRGARRC